MFKEVNETEENIFPQMSASRSNQLNEDVK